MTDHMTDAGTRGDDFFEHVRIGRLSKDEFRLGERGPLQSRWFVSVPFSSFDYDELRTHAAHSVLTSDVIEVTGRYATWVLGVHAGNTLHQLFVLVFGTTVAEMLAELVTMTLYLMFETADGRVIELRVPTPAPLLSSLAKIHCAASDDAAACLSVLSTAALLLSKHGAQPKNQHEEISRFTVTAVLQPELTRIISDESDISL